MFSGTLRSIEISISGITAHVAVTLPEDAGAEALVQSRNATLLDRAVRASI
jgi:hypothetical protein